MLKQACDETISDKDRLLGWGFKDHHLIEYPDGTIGLNLDTLQMDWSLTLMQMTAQSGDDQRP